MQEGEYGYVMNVSEELFKRAWCNRLQHCIILCCCSLTKVTRTGHACYVSI